VICNKITIVIASALKISIPFFSIPPSMLTKTAFYL